MKIHGREGMSGKAGLQRSLKGWHQDYQGREFLLWLSGSRIWLETMKLRVQSLASLSGLRIQHCHELWWCRSQMQLRSRVAVAVVQVGSYSSDSTPSLGTSIYHGCNPKKDQKKKNYQGSQIKKAGVQAIIFTMSWKPWVTAESKESRRKGNRQRRGTEGFPHSRH